MAIYHVIHVFRTFKLLILKVPHGKNKKKSFVGYCEIHWFPFTSSETLNGVFILIDISSYPFKK